MKIPINEIKVEKKDLNTKRFRSDFGDINELAESLKKHGLMHPIVVNRLDNDPKFKYTLVAGERRLTAALLLCWTEIEATIKSDLSALQQKEMELEENIQRKDINWQERIESVRQMDELKRAQFGERKPGDSSDKGWTIHDTAKLLNQSIGTVSQDLQLAKDLFENPELLKKIGKMPKQVARKIVEREKRTAKMQKLVEKREINLTTDLKLGSCLDHIKDIPTSSIACLITDPPWAVEGVNEVEKGNLSGKYNNETALGDENEMTLLYESLIPELSRVLIPGAHFYMFFGIQWYDRLCRMLKLNNFTVHPSPLVWMKGRPTMIPNPYHYVPGYELILTGCKNPQNRTLLKPCSNCLVDYPADAGAKRVHSLQKPIALMEMFINNSTSIGETVLDPFAGSAVVLKAAKKLGRKGIGFELNEDNFYASQEWLAEKD